jgi:hypothetical protein
MPGIEAIIKRISEDKRARKIAPEHVLFYEILNITGERKNTESELNRLYFEGKIITGDTINDKYIILK